MPKTRSLLLKLAGTLLFVYLFYMCIVLIHGTINDYQPPERQLLPIESQQSTSILQDSVISLLTWNIGYAGLGAQSNFFYHGSGFFWSGDKMVHSSKTQVDQYFSGITKFLQSHPADIYLVQEIDRNSNRSYNLDQYNELQNALASKTSIYAPNFRVRRVPIPILEPWNVYGKAESGLALFSKHVPHTATRYQLPGQYGWPKRIFQLDRCLLVSRFKMQSTKELVVINLHNSAYDKKGELKQQQMAYLKKLATAEYEQGNYVIAGGDWNQFPPFFNPETFAIGKATNRKKSGIAPDLFPPDWHWIYDPTVPTIRNNYTIYDPKNAQVGLIDFFLISPNIKALEVKGLDHQFQFSDHQAVWMNVALIR